MERPSLILSIEGCNITLGPTLIRYSINPRDKISGTCHLICLCTLWGLSLQQHGSYQHKTDSCG